LVHRISLHTKFHTPGTYGQCLLLQNRKLIKYSYGSHVTTLHSTKHTDLPQQTPRGFKGSGTIHNSKPWRQGRANITTSCVRHVIICWGKVRRWRGCQQHNSYQISIKTVSQRAEEGNTQADIQMHPDGSSAPLRK